MEQLHSWTQSEFIGAAMLDGLPYITVVQEYRCRKCGQHISLPNCKLKGCQILLSLGCQGETERPKVIRPNPYEGRDDDEPKEKNKKDYQRHQKGKRNQ